VRHSFPSIKVTAFMAFYRLLWLIFMPLVLFYLKRRARREPVYIDHLGERFGFGAQRSGEWVWIHAVSLGEFRSAIPLIDALLARGERVVITHFAPAGRGASMDHYSDQIAAGKLAVCWIPFDYGLAFRRFFRRFSIRYGLVMEVEFWPSMIMSARAAKIPLFLCNGQYPNKSYQRDKGRILSARDIVPGFAGVLVKSNRMAEPFRELGLGKIAVTGEMRFEQPINQIHIDAAVRVRSHLSERPVLTFASAVKDEDALFITAIQSLKSRMPDALIVYVPRKPEHFDRAAELIQAAGLSVARRSVVLDAMFELEIPLTCDVLLGDSLGEMHFYLAVADQVVVGGSFAPQGSHNIIEPLSQGKPTIVGPNTWTIDFPAVEAIEAEVVRQVSPNELADALLDLSEYASADAFMSVMGGSVEKTLDAVSDFMER
jgi:3-deoxy-D-manno-octulosonic-acid transferase